MQWQPLLRIPFRAAAASGVRAIKQLKMTDHYYAELIDTHVEINNAEAYQVHIPRPCANQHSSWAPPRAAPLSTHLPS